MADNLLSTSEVERYKVYLVQVSLNFLWPLELRRPWLFSMDMVQTLLLPAVCCLISSQYCLVFSQNQIYTVHCFHFHSCNDVQTVPVTFLHAHSTQMCHNYQLCRRWLPLHCEQLGKPYISLRPDLGHSPKGVYYP